MLCLREPSLGPSFGMKGGAAGGGYAQVVPMEDINLHFTGDFHAITSAHNLLSALIDNHIYWGNALGIDSRRVAWRRVIDMNDRALREIVCSLGGVANGFPREDGFDITVASEVMAIFCLASDLDDLKKRLGNIVVAYTRDRKPVRAERSQGARRHGRAAEGGDRAQSGADAGRHARFHPWRPVRQHRAWLQLGAGDHDGAEARRLRGDRGRLRRRSRRARSSSTSSAARPASTPDCAVLVATIRALKMHGGVKKEDLKKEDLKALEAGMANLQRHVENVQKFGMLPVVSINRFSADTEAEIALVKDKCKALGVEALMADHWAMGGEGAADVARAVVKVDRRAARASSNCSIPTTCRCSKRSAPSPRKSIAPRTSPPTSRCATSSRISRRWATASSRSASPRRSISFSTNPDTKGAPSDHIITCARCGCRPAPSSWWRSAVRS